MSFTWYLHTVTHSGGGGDGGRYQMPLRQKYSCRGHLAEIRVAMGNGHFNERHIEGVLVKEVWRSLDTSGNALLATEAEVLWKCRFPESSAQFD